MFSYTPRAIQFLVLRRFYRSSRDAESASTDGFGTFKDSPKGELNDSVIHLSPRWGYFFRDNIFSTHMPPRWAKDRATLKTAKNPRNP